MIKLRAYQEKAITDIKTEFNKGFKHVILQAPTGAGKTVIFSDLSKRTALKGKKILILTDRIELLTQAGGSLKKVGLNSFFIQAGTKYVSNAFSSYIVMSQTLRRRIELNYWKEFIKTIGLIIIDECHKQEFNYLFESGLIDNTHVIGFTATPKRSGRMRQLALDYEKLIPTVSVKWLIDNGYLVNDDYFGLNTPDMSQVDYNYMTGDFAEKSMFKEFNTPQLYAGVVKNYKKLTPNTKTLVFCVNIEHSIKTCLKFKEQGLNVKFITSSVSKPKEPETGATEGKIAQYNERLRIYTLYKKNFKELSGDRTQIFEDFKQNKFDILVNAGIATTGYDCPSLQTIILNRATLSVTLLLQMIGRGSRIFDKKTHFNILDFGGNCSRLGYYSENRLWSLWHEHKDGKGLPPMKDCGFTNTGKPISSKQKGCRRMILASYKICPFCGFKYPTKKEKEIELATLMYNGNKAIRTKNLKDMNYEELHLYWKVKGHKSAWLWRQLWYRNKNIQLDNLGKNLIGVIVL